MRYYPTDLLLAVEAAERRLREQPDAGLALLFREAGLSRPSALLNTRELAEGLDELLGGLSQYPWQPLTDSNDVCLLSPVGTVVITDRRAGNTLRGLLLAWATGNHVVVRTARPRFWQDLTARLRLPGHPLPDCRTITTQPAQSARSGESPEAADLTSTGVSLDVPDIVLLPADGTPAPPDGELYAPPGSPARPALEIHLDPNRAVASQDLAGSILRMDCRAEWAQRLFRRRYLKGTTLAAARSRDTAQADDRLGAKLRYLTGRARRTPYYRGLPDARSLADLAHLPILDKAALQAHSLPAGRDLCSGDSPSGEVLRSGATTGAPRYIVYSRTDWNNMVREAIPLFYGMGLEPGDRLINTLFGGDLYGGLTTTLTEFTRMPLECYTTAQAVTVDSLLMLVDSFAANALIGVPTLLLPLLREAVQRDPGLRIEKVLYLGTAMSDSDQTWLRDNLGTRIISSVLAANDGAQLGYQCPYMSGRLHHLNDDYNLVEVIDDDGRPLPAGTTGQLLTTSLQKFEGPLIRYRVGDRGRIVEHDCPCGIRGRVLEYHGRADGAIRVKGEVLQHQELLSELSVFQVSELQAHITSRDGREILTLRVESPVPLEADHLREHLRTAFKVLGNGHMFDDGLDVFSFGIETYLPGLLPRNESSGKIRPVIDDRLART
ncbi:phenylacetate--CoA ligase family protein [Streptomyces sp. NBC_01298]|uniref:phenylacetate--CoA ligase family protein n=1 Tax=Streptomyces sp. NBC_01298 TaxID=2903817 RepID=UPI002E130B8E|nr:phenylacetate--CoA ligase family protein [Streptomyces sp. NBC_01298]